MIKRLPSSYFTWDNYCKSDYSLNDVVNDDLELINKYELLGYCKSEELAIRPRDRQLALLFFDKDNNCEFWIHVPLLGTLKYKLELEELK